MTGTRSEKKLQTRQALMDAALSRIARGGSFDGLSLREVTADAGVTPGSFYRHFRDMEELGLALVDETCAHLRKLIRNARQNTLSGEAILQQSVNTFFDYVNANRIAFHFLSRERYGGSKPVREAIAREIRGFVVELSADLKLFPHFNTLPRDDLEMICGLLVNTVINELGNVLELPPEHPDVRGALATSLLKQMRVIVLGGLAWKPGKQVPETPT